MRQAEELLQTMDQQAKSVQQQEFDNAIAQAVRESQEEQRQPTEKAQSGLKVTPTLAMQQPSHVRNDGTEGTAEQKSLS